MYNPQRVVMEVIIMVAAFAEMAVHSAFRDVIVCKLLCIIFTGAQISKITLNEGNLFGFFKVFSCLIPIAAGLFYHLMLRYKYGSIIVTAF